jgi:hypothetical protein
MHARLRVFGLLFVVAALSGCASVQGTWSLADVDPTAARRDFSFASLTLQEDGTFYGEQSAGGIRTASGTYTYQDDTLTLRTHEGEVREYAAELHGDELVLAQPWQGGRVRATFIREE